MNEQNPSGFDTEKRLLLALLLSTAVLLLGPFVLHQFFPEPPEEPMSPISTPSVSAPAIEEEPTQEAVGEVAEGIRESAEIQAEDGTPTVGLRRQVQIENKNLRLILDSRGGGLLSVQLLQYLSSTGAPLELIPSVLEESPFKPIVLSSLEEQVSRQLQDLVYEVAVLRDGQEVDSSGVVIAPVRVLLTYRGSGMRVERWLDVPVDGYVIRGSSRVFLGGREHEHGLILGPGIGRSLVTASGGFFGAGAGDFDFPTIAYYAGGSVERKDVGDAEESPLLEVSPEWVAMDSRFFGYALISPGEIQGLRLRKYDAKAPVVEGEAVETTTVASEVRLRAGAEYDLFFGPKDLELLRRASSTLVELVDYGWFAFLVKPLLFCLKLAYGWVGNYGWAIIIVTFFINLVLLPIRYKQITSMRKMSEVQPQLKAIQSRYKKLPKGDPKRQEMNQEIMALYQQHGVNPLGGCLPLLVQMPFLFAFYRMLASSIELRGAPFMLWIQDLSLADPYYVTPLIMGATMVLQQKMTPATGDPAQRRMMMLMPVMFTFFFLSISSGLVIYFLFSNVFGMLFQVGMQRLQAEEAGKPSSKPKKNSRKAKSVR